MILCSNPQAQYVEHKEAIDSAISQVLQSGIYILGPETEAFEQEFAEFTQTEYCSGVANGTDALLLALKACDVGEGDEVITVSLTASATAAAIHQSGAEAVLVDVDPESYTLDINQLQEKISSKTKAIIPVHLYGHPAEIDAIMNIATKHGLYVIEDCAQAHGATYNGKQVGSFGDLGCFSFYPTKNLGAIGDGGAVVSSNRALADKVKLLREYGWKEKFNSSIHGWNSRLDEIQAAILRVKLKKLTHLNKRRSDLADIYNRKLAGLDLILPSVQDSCGHVYHLFVIRINDRDRLMRHLREQGIQAGIHYPTPLHRQEVYQSNQDDLKITDAYCKEILSLPMYPELGDNIDTVCSAIIDFYKHK
ncbi:MAG: DegT/DnrJ/EryC1/StrS family aminotransferase [Flavobacteriales bacterium]|nr:DegT/DnrJ/EryC1/StrS family aminotransferase [Gammaproteobacteria bacterium]MBL4667914.1 DegT/DnrJ/EryC1/StrS family aminotransferase [Flavobacteriales bacterium]